MAFGRNKIVVQPSWHPNFRIVETLPDTKVIRTDFAFNGVSVVIAVVLLGLVLKAEYTGLALNREISKYESEIANKSGTNKENLGLSSEFDRLSKDFTEVALFMDVHLTPAEVLLAVTDILPREIITQSLSYDDVAIQDGRRSVRTKGIDFRGIVKGAPDQATAIVTKLQEDIANHEDLKPLIQKVELNSLVRGNDGFNVSIRVVLTPR